MVEVTQRTCASCPSLIMADHARRTLPPEERKAVRSHRGRGLCSRCYESARRDGTRIDHEPLSNPRDVLLDRALDYVGVRQLRYADLPGALGVTREALTRAVRRAALSGDSRAIALAELNNYSTKGSAA